MIDNFTEKIVAAVLPDPGSEESNSSSRSEYLIGKTHFKNNTLVLGGCGRRVFSSFGAFMNLPSPNSMGFYLLLDD